MAAFLRRSSAILRKSFALPHFPEFSGTRAQQPCCELLGSRVLPCFSPALGGARLMCSVPSTKLFVGGLAWSMDENSLRDAFVKYGEVVEAKVVLDRETGRSKGFGFVSFTCIDDAEAAMKGLDGTVLSGRPLRVNFAVEKQRGFGTFGGGSSFDSGSSSSFNDSYSAPSTSNTASFSNDTFSDSTFGGSSTAAGNKDSIGQDSNFFDDSAFDELGDDLDSNQNFADGSR